MNNEIRSELKVEDETYLTEVALMVKNKVIPIIDNIINRKGYATENEIAMVLNKSLGTDVLPLTSIGNECGFTENPFSVEDNHVYIDIKPC